MALFSFFINSWSILLWVFAVLQKGRRGERLFLARIPFSDPGGKEIKIRGSWLLDAWSRSILHVDWRAWRLIISQECIFTHCTYLASVIIGPDWTPHIAASEIEWAKVAKVPQISTWDLLSSLLEWVDLLLGLLFHDAFTMTCLDFTSGCSWALLEHIVVRLEFISGRNIHKVLRDWNVWLTLLFEISLVRERWRIVVPGLVIRIHVFLRRISKLLM